MKHVSILIISSFFLLFSTLAFSQDDGYLAFAEQMPEPVGGLSAIYSLVEYPAQAKKAGVEGKVYVLAFINENGGVDEVKVIKGLGAGCDQATIKAVKNSKFSPGKSGGNAAKIKLSMQFEFKLS